MPRPAAQLREDARAIWHAGLAAVDAARLVRQNLQVDGAWLCLGPHRLRRDALGRIVVVGAGKAGAAMAQGVEGALAGEPARRHQLQGWVNVPDDCLRPLQAIHLHPAREAGANEPRPAGVEGAQAILNMVGQLGPHDLCLVLLSGGASALLPAPVAGIPLAEKLALTRALSAAGADIRALNTVRKQLSRIKGGRLAQACRAGTLAALIISDVPGDPVDIIGSGPTVSDPSTAADALQVLQNFHIPRGLCRAAWDYLETHRAPPVAPAPPPRPVWNLVIGNNALAVDAAGAQAERRGYAHAMRSAAAPEGEADDLGRHLAQLARQMRQGPGPDCLITGGEPVVTLGSHYAGGRGGRNQQLVLSALVECWASGCEGWLLWSAGTDGEDGPTDAAGAFVDQAVWQAAHEQGLDPRRALCARDAYPLLAAAGALIRTGPTHTNVCDLRVMLVDRQELGRRG